MKLDQAIQEHLEKLPLALQVEVLDYVLYLEQKTGKPSTDDNERRKSLASALEKVAAMNPYADVDPVAWVREQREERAFLELHGVDGAICATGIVFDNLKHSSASEGTLAALSV